MLEDISGPGLVEQTKCEEAVDQSATENSFVGTHQFQSFKIHRVVHVFISKQFMHILNKLYKKYMCIVFLFCKFIQYW